MVPASQIPVLSTAEVRRFSQRLALVYGAVFGLVGISLPYFPVWLRAVGIDVGWIGVITAVPSLTRFTVLPLVTGSAERYRILRQAIVILAFLTSLGFLVIGQFNQPLPILLLFILTACVWTPIVPMVDGYALKGVTQYGLDYGPLRLWGSAAFVIGALACGLLIDVVAATYVIWVIAAMALVGAVMSLGLRPLGSAPATKALLPAGALLRQPGFLAIIFTSALVQGSHAAYYALGSIAWQGAGLGGLTISGLWSLGVVAEIVVFAISPRFTWSPVALVAFAAASAALRWVLTAQQPSLSLLALVQMMHGLSYGMTQVGIVGLLTRHVPSHVMATAQGYLVAAGGIVMSSATVASGQLYARYGEGVYYAMSGMALTGGCLILLAGRRLNSATEID
jgi:MFS transporter, PPP family, 3-phenylpropionic acid transporter